jgi:hypothetical protein
MEDNDGQFYYRNEYGAWCENYDNLKDDKNEYTLPYLRKCDKIAGVVGVHSEIDYEAALPEQMLLIIMENGATVRIQHQNRSSKTQPPDVNEQNPIIEFVQGEELHVRTFSGHWYAFRRGNWVEVNTIYMRRTPPCEGWQYGQERPHPSLPILFGFLHSFRQNFTECYIAVPCQKEFRNPKRGHIICYDYDSDERRYKWRSSFPYFADFVETAGGYFLTIKGHIVNGRTGLAVMHKVDGLHNLRI